MALRLALVLVVLAILVGVKTASGNHNVYLPLVPNTPLMQSEIKTQEVTWCANDRASKYPNFLSQLRDVNAQYTEREGIRFREVPYDSSCQLHHDMPETHGCGSGCAAWVFYTNWPVTIEYKWQLGYTDWRSAQGHEMGHALLGLHEQYNDSSGNIGCTGRQDTVMDCGSGVKYPTSLDIGRGCAIIKTAWCGKPPGEQCLGPVDQSWGGTWNPCDQLWHGPDSYPWNYSPSKGEWFDRNGASEWCCQQDYGGYYNRRVEEWYWSRPSVWRWSEKIPMWTCATNCP